MSTRLGFFPYTAMNYKRAQAYLDQKAEQGWTLKHIYLGGLARFEPADQPHHFVDLDLTRNDFDETDETYLQLCADAGWAHVQTLRGMLLFRSAPGASPVPIQSDREIEWERFWEKYRPRLSSTLLLVLLLGVLILLFSISGNRNITIMLASNSTLLYVLYLLMGCLYIPLEWLHSRWYLSRCRKAGQVENPGPLATLLDCLVWFRTPLLWLILVLAVTGLFGSGRVVDLDWYPPHEEYSATVEACREWPVVLASDLGLPDSESSRHLEGHRSLIGSALEYRELTDGTQPDLAFHILTTERYECSFEFLAKWAFAQRQRETRNGAFLWGALDWEPLALPGFDESCTYWDNGILLLRQGKIVALVYCSGVDLTTPEHLAVIQRRVFHSK